tara:strand:- start:1396 stop:2640 length:1245 start_codon:yes stop_codon:yes gene_type:complete
MATPDGTVLTVTPAGGERVLALDGLRGLAVAGIALMNVMVFSMPPAAYFNPRAYGGEDPLALALWTLSFLVVEDKFRALFAMMFGAGVTILLGKHGAHPLRAHFARMSVLFVIGMAHAVLLAGNEVLRVYAVAGLALPLFVNMRPRTLYWLAAVIIATQVLVALWLFRDWIAYWWQVQTGAVSDVTPLHPLEASYGADPQAIAAALERGREDFVERLTRRLGLEPWLTLRVMAGLPSSFAAMLIGIGLWRSGLLAWQWASGRALCLAGWCALASLPALGLMAIADFVSGFDPLVTALNALVLSAPFDIVLAAAWAALAMVLFAGGGMFTRLWAAAGRMALSNYIATSLIFSILFTSWGLGLFGIVSRPQALALCLVPIGAMLIWSPLWLDRFRQGPAEWLWRSLAKGRVLPVKR